MKLNNTELNHLDKKEWIKVGLTFLTYILGMAYFFYMEHHLFSIEKVMESLQISEEAAEHGIAGLAYALACAVMSLIFFVINKELLEEQFKAMKHHFKHYVIWSIIGAFLVLAIQLLNSHFFHGPHHAFTSVSFSLAGTVVGIFGVIAISFGVAFVEEVFYKVCCYLPVEELKPLQSGIVSALLFGLFNMLIFLVALPHYALGAFLLYTALGLKFAFLYSRTHTIYTSVTAGTLYALVFTILSLAHIVH